MLSGPKFSDAKAYLFSMQNIMDDLVTIDGILLGESGRRHIIGDAMIGRVGPDRYELMTCDAGVFEAFRKRMEYYSAPPPEGVTLIW
jgi:hypothetical protein